MEHRIKSRFNDDILRQAMRRYGIAPASIHLLDGFESFIYEFERADGEYVLRIGHSLRRSIPMIQGKVNWINYLVAGGVLIRVEHHDRRHEWEARLGLPRGQATRSVFDSEAAERAILGEIPEEELWQDASRRLGLSADQLASFRLDFWKSETLDAELALLIRTLRPRYKVSIISNAWSDARVYQLALKRLDVHAKEAVFVDDMLGNVQAAQALGMKGVPFKNTEQTITEIKEYLDEHSTT